jgi:hypothetical protein
MSLSDLSNVKPLLLDSTQLIWKEINDERIWRKIN